jgi:hypothetical protein
MVRRKRSKRTAIQPRTGDVLAEQRPERAFTLSGHPKLGPHLVQWIR